MTKGDIDPEKAAKLLKMRQATDPLCHYVMPPTLAQCSASKIRFKCVKAKNQVGKTAFEQYTASAMLRNRHPTYPKLNRPSTGLIIVPSRQQAAEVWGRRLLKASTLKGDMGRHPWIPKREIKQVSNAYSPVGSYPGRIEMKNGNSAMIVLSGDQNSWKRIEGMVIDWIVRDEVAGDENMADELNPRILTSYSRYLDGEQSWGGWMLWAATETKYNSEWEDFKKRCYSGVTDHAIFEPTVQEASAYVSMAAREAMKDSMSAQSYAIRGDGDLDAGDLVQIYGKQWDDKRHLLKHDRQIQAKDNIWIGWDPGVEHPTGIVIAVLDAVRPGTMQIVRCFLHSRETVDFDVECIHSVLLGRRLAGFVYDYRANEKHKHARSLFSEFVDKMEAKGYTPMTGYTKSDKRHAIGINSVREMLDPNPFDKSIEPNILLNPSQESGCTMLRDQIISYRGREATNFTGAGGVVKKNDDLVDPLRYLTRARPYYSASFHCGEPKFAAEAPLEAPPTPVPQRQETSLEAHRRRLGEMMANRNQRSVGREFSWMRMSGLVRN